jgi:ABC-type transporter Mla MlaB component
MRRGIRSVSLMVDDWPQRAGDDRPEAADAGAPPGAAPALAQPPPPPPRLAGRFTPARGAELLASARAWSAGDGDVSVACAELERLDVVSLQILLSLKRDLDARGRRLRFQGMSDAVIAVLTLAGLGEELLS